MGLAWLYGWESATLPLPVLVVAGLVLAIAANADKQIRIKVRRSTREAGRSPQTLTPSASEPMNATPPRSTVMESRQEAQLPVFRSQTSPEAKSPVSFNIYSAEPSAEPNEGDRSSR